MNRPATDPWVVALAALWALLVTLYLWSAPPGITMEDTPLFALVCETAGLGHPPGYPLYAWLCPPFASGAQAAGLAPAFGAATASAVWGATACTLLAATVRRVTNQPGPALLAAGLVGVAPAWWDQAQIPEVYTLNAMLVAWCWYCCQRIVAGDGRRWLPGLAVGGGLGLAAHWPLFIATGPALLLWLAPRWRTLLAAAADRRLLATTVAAFLAGLSPYLHFWLVDPTTAFVFIDDYDTDQILPYVRRDIYGWEGEVLSWAVRREGLALVLGWFVTEFRLLFAVPLAGGLALLWWRGDRWAAAAVTWGMAATTVLGALLRPFDPALTISVWVFHAYILPGLLFAGLPLAVGAGWATRHVRSQRVALVLALGVVAAVGTWHFPAADRRGDDIAVRRAQLLLEDAPPGALVLRETSDFNFASLYLLHTSHPRPDLEFAHLDDWLEMTRLGTATAAEAADLIAAVRTRPVLTERHLDVEGLGQRFSGTHFTFALDVAGSQHRLEIDAAARALITDAMRLNAAGIRNSFTAALVESLIINYTSALLGARRRGDALAVADTVLLNELLATPAGRFAEVVVVALGKDPPPTLSQLDAALDQVWRQWDGLSVDRRADLLHLLANARIIAGNFSGGKNLLEEALAVFPSHYNYRVLIDLLQINGEEGDHAAYAALRRRYPGLGQPPALAAHDAACATALGAPCAPPALE